MKSFGTITTLLGFDFRLYESTITRTACTEVLEVLIDPKLHFLLHADNVFSHAVSLLALIRTVNFSCFLSAEHLKLYCTLDISQNIPLISGIPLLLLMPVSLNLSRESSYVLIFVILFVTWNKITLIF
jgi:hypothetical protein